MTINSYLLDILHKIQNQIPLDEFYNILYNSEDVLNKLGQVEKIDETVYALPNVVNTSSYTISLVLGVFKNPQSLGTFVANINPSEVKLTSVNYHELLRTFLAVKILSDILIQLPESSVELDHTIPRLSIYKTYYIICQKLISLYPSSSNTVSEQQKIILGQSKLGKLIKLVYPNLRIKRLGSRGESKYNYLGVVWNDQIVHEDTRQLCENNELPDLTNYFMLKKIRMGKQTKRKPSGGRASRKRTVSGNKPIASLIEGTSSSINAGTLPLDDTGDVTIPSTLSSSATDVTFAPQLSFIKPFLKFPTFEDFLLVPESGESWFDNVAREQAAVLDNVFLMDEEEEITSIIDMVQSIFIDELEANENLESSLLTNFLTRIMVPHSGGENNIHENIDLRIYLIVIVKLLPYLLLLTSSGSDNHSSFLQTLRSSLIQFINNYTDSLSSYNIQFPHTHATIFCIILKKLINVNDLLITFIKLIMKDEGFPSTRSSMTLDIQNYLISPSPSLSFENNEIRFNFKEDIVQNDLIFSLMGYNYNAADKSSSGSGSDTQSSAVSLKFVREEASLIEKFFKVDLVGFLSADPLVASSQIGEEAGLIWTNLLTNQEYRTVTSLIRLLHDRLLSVHFKSRYPILVYHNFISCILNDLLKHIYSKQQLQQQIQLQSSFGNWWVFNSFVEEYIGLMGEIVGLFQSI